MFANYQYSLTGEQQCRNPTVAPPEHLPRGAGVGGVAVAAQPHLRQLLECYSGVQHCRTRTGGLNRTKRQSHGVRGLYPC